MDEAQVIHPEEGKETPFRVALKIGRIDLYSCRDARKDIETQGDLGALPPVRGSTPVPRSKLNDDGYITYI